MEKQQKQDVDSRVSDYHSLDVTAIFIDIEDSTGIANHYRSDDYRLFLSQYHAIVSTVLEDKQWDPIKHPVYHNFFGDEFMAFLVHSSYENQSVSKALELATKLKLAWYISKENKERLDSDKEVIEVNVGVNYGAVFSMTYPLISGTAQVRESTLEGFPITIAKRAQSVCEHSRASRIILADAAYRQYVAETRCPHEFDYLGRQSLKGLAQSMSCYEWLGGDYDHFKHYFPPGDIESTLEKLYYKNPLNPWYALLLAYYYYKIAEEKWYESDGREVSPFYNKAGAICLKAIQSITGVRLRQLSSLLLTCLEIQGRWDELRHRAEQAFGADPTFAQASALNAWAAFRFGLTSEDKVKDAAIKDAATRAIQTAVLFERGEGDEGDLGDEVKEALYRAHVVLAHEHSESKRRDEALAELQKAINYAVKAKLDWSETELKKLKEEGAFKHMREADWKNVIGDLEEEVQEMRKRKSEK